MSSTTRATSRCSRLPSNPMKAMTSSYPAASMKAPGWLRLACRNSIRPRRSGSSRHCRFSPVIARSEATKQSILSVRIDGLLRFARNDAEPRATANASVPVIRQHRQRRDLDAFVDQRARFVRRGFAVDRAVLDAAVMHLARFVGEALADIVGVFDDVIAQFLDLGAQLALLRHQQRRR